MKRRFDPGNGPAADDLNGDCPAVSEDGWLCTRERNHDNQHRAEGKPGDVLKKWD